MGQKVVYEAPTTMVIEVKQEVGICIGSEQSPGGMTDYNMQNPVVW